MCAVEPTGFHCSFNIGRIPKTAVTSLYAGDDIKTVQANLGHATAQFTLDVYGHVTQKMRQDSASRMQKFYEQLNTENSQ